MNPSPEVPRITISGRVVSSSANVPRNQCDSCACWSTEDMAQARKAMKDPTRPIYVTDETSRAAMLSLAIDMLSHNKILCAPQFLKRGY